MKQLNWIDTGAEYVAVDDRGHVQGLLRAIGGLSDTRSLKPLKSNPRPLKTPNPKVDQRIQDRRDYQNSRRRKGVMLSRK